MRFIAVTWSLLIFQISTIGATATQGLYDLLERRLPGHSVDFNLSLIGDLVLQSTTAANDTYSVSAGPNGTIHITGSSLSALNTGIRRYFTDVAGTDIYWFIGSRLNTTTLPLPRPQETLTGASIVPWRYYFNTVTFSYTTPFWSWEDWESQLDWLALHGVNLPLAWVGFEKILLDAFQAIGLTTEQIIPFFSGPAFQAWNRFGNIQGSWGGDLPLQWIDSQFVLQQKIVTRMVELGITPVLPAFTGFVPRALVDVYPDATVVNGSQWSGFPTQYTNTTFLEPSDPLFTKLQDLVVGKQIEYYGNITRFYTLDQYNENDPSSGDLDYLRNVTHGTWQSLKAANPAAVWVMQGWLFYSNADFWTNDRVKAYLSGVENDEDMLILDLFSESQPQWQRTDSYYGKPWIWCQLHDYGGNMGLYGQISNVTVNPIEALANSSSLVGFGLTPEGQEGNEIMYKLLLDQAWQSKPIDTNNYFEKWTQTRYGIANNHSSVPAQLYTAWELLRRSAYNNTNLTSNAVSKGIHELAPNITTLVNRTGHHPTTINYDPALMIEVWHNAYNSSVADPSLWTSPAYTHDLVDITRQVLSNAFIAEYTLLISTWSTSTPTSNTTSAARAHAANLALLLHILDDILSALPQFSFAPWITSARTWATVGTPSSSPPPTTTPLNASSATTATQDFFAYNARNQITLWGPTGQISDYASKSWAGLVGDYYLPRWLAFLAYLEEVGVEGYEDGEARERVSEVEVGFQDGGVDGGLGMREGWSGGGEGVRGVVESSVVPALGRLGVM